MKKLYIQISDTKQITEILNKKNYLILIFCLVFLIIDYDLFNPRPRLLITEGYFWKSIAIIFQTIFIVSIIKWRLKKQKIKAILTNGIITQGIVKKGVKIKANKTASFYIHLLEYKVSNKKYQVTLKNKKSTLKSNLIIYQADIPVNSVIYEDADLYKKLKELILVNVKSLPENSISSISTLEELTR